MTYKEEFSKSKLSENLAKYEMYYQISLGSLVSDLQTDKINPEIEIQYALGSLYELVSELLPQENADEIFEVELQKQSAMDALQNFVNSNLDLVKDGKIKVEPIVNAINDGIFYHKSMLEIYEKNLDSQIEKWSNHITQDMADKIYQSVLDMQNR